MSQLMRIFRINYLLSTRRVVSAQTIQEDLEISPATMKRDLQLMRDQMNAPITFNRQLKGYQYRPGQSLGPQFQLPGLWLNPSEAYALITAQVLLEDIEPGLVSDLVRPFQQLLVDLISRNGGSEEPLSWTEIAQRIQVIQSLRHRVPLTHFQSVAYAAIHHQKLSVTFNTESMSDSASDLPVILSPQRMTYYRENWFLDAWSHALQALRTYGLDELATVTVLDEPAELRPLEEVDRVLNTGFGAYVGEVRRTAVLDFSPDRARALQRLTWADQHEGTWLDNGWYRVSVEYNNEKALVKDILRHCPGILVQSPEPLKQRVRDALLAGLALYA